jgi:hypothetical protein
VGRWGDGKLCFQGRSNKRSADRFRGVGCARDLNEALSDVRESSPFATAASPLLLTNYLSFLPGQNNSLFRTLEQECQEIQGPPHVASGTKTVCKAALNRDILRLVLKSLAELALSCFKVDLELQLICRLRDNLSWCGTDGRHDGSTTA